MGKLAFSGLWPCGLRSINGDVGRGSSKVLPSEAIENGWLVVSAEVDVEEYMFMF